MIRTPQLPKLNERRGFTLVELLVVIGIIAILISVLLPVLGSARRSAQSVKCLSNLKNLHNSLLMYAGDFKNCQPCARQDDVDPVTKLAINQNNRYWVDMLYPYVFRRPSLINAFTQQDATAYHASILWCPSWAAEHPELDVYKNYTDRFKNGYGFNIYFGFKPNYPNPDAMLPPTQQAMYSAIWNSGIGGKYWKRNEISDQANRMVIADSNLWLVGMGITDSAGTLKGQAVTPVSEHNSTPGGMNYDRYRHGKYPKNDGTRFDTKGGITAFNVRYFDGHAATLNSAQDGYKAIRLRYP